MKGFYNSIRLKREIIKFFYQNTRLIFMALSLVVGVLMGTLALKNGWFCDPSQQASSFSRFFSSRSGMTTFQIFLNSFASSLVYLLISFSCGLFLFGKPVSYVLPFIRGIQTSYYIPPVGKSNQKDGGELPFLLSWLHW